MISLLTIAGIAIIIAGGWLARELAVMDRDKDRLDLVGLQRYRRALTRAQTAAATVIASAVIMMATALVLG